VIGANCNINHAVTIGVKYGGKHPGVPIIGERVFVGPGAAIIGGIVVGSDAAIGAHAVVVASIPDRGVVAGVPAKLISLSGSGEYVTNTVTSQPSERSSEAKTDIASDVHAPER
jgi:serine O-acetyltransferase